MKIVHFDVDEELAKHLEGEKYQYSLQNLSNPSQFVDVEGISTKSQSRVTKESLASFLKLKLLITRTVGTDHIDLNYCREKGIAVYHIEDYGAFNIAEHVFALLLSGTRNIIKSQTEIQQGIFSYKGNLGIALRGKALGIIGTGKIGLEVIKRANAFEMKVVAYDVFQNEKAAQELDFKYVSLKELAKIADIISLHAPLLDSTKHIINEEIISHMKDGVILINTARGGLIDTSALVTHIKKFGLVGLDVLEEESSFSKNHPLLQLENVVITPHIAFYSDESVKTIAEETKKLVHNFESGNNEGRVE